MSRRVEALFDEALERLRRGESLDACLARYPEDAQELRPLLETALYALSTEAPPEPRRAAEGWSKLRARLAEEHRRAQAAEARRGAGFFAALATPMLALGRLAPQPLLRGAALTLFAALFGFGGLVTASSLGPAEIVPSVQKWFGREAPPDVEGVIVAVQGPTLTVVDEDGLSRVVLLDERTVLVGRGPPSQLSQLTAGLEVDVDGVVGDDSTVLAQRVKVEGPQVRLRQDGLEVEVRGVVVGAQGDRFQVATPAGPLTIIVGPETRLDLEGRAKAIADGLRVDVRGVRQADGSVLALRVQVREGPPIAIPARPAGDEVELDNEDGHEPPAQGQGDNHSPGGDGGPDGED